MRLRELFGKQRDRKRGLRRSLASELLDAEWYAAAHGVSLSGDALLTHCADVAFTRGFAPRASMAAADGVSLAPWALAALRRLGVAFRAPSTGPLKADAPGVARLEDLENPRGVRLAVVSSIIGPFDALPIQPAAYADRVDFFVVTDRMFEPLGPWRPVVCPVEHPNPRIRSRYAKANLAALFPAYEWTLWVDGNVALLVDPLDFLEAQTDAQTDVAFFGHVDRSSIIEEVEACHRYGKDRLAVMMDELGHTLPEGRELDDLLVNGSVFFARTAGAAQDFGALWWDMIQSGSQRDQLSLPLALRRTPGLAMRVMPGRPARNPYFKTFNH